VKDPANGTVYIVAETRLAGPAVVVQTTEVIHLFCGLCMQVKDPAKGTVYIVAEARLAALPGAVPKAKKGGDKKKGKDGEAAAPAPAGFELLAKFQGAELVSGRFVLGIGWSGLLAAVCSWD
jgi:hypothetical protein